MKERTTYQKYDLDGLNTFTLSEKLRFLFVYKDTKRESVCERDREREREKKRRAQTDEKEWLL